MNNLTLDAEALYTELLAGVRGLWRQDMVLLGVWSGGAWLAERLSADLGLSTAPGVISSTLHRDDFGARGLASGTDPTRIPFAVDGAHILLLDDVLFTGRTIRAVGPKTLVPGDLNQMGVRVCHDMAEGLKDVDVVIMLRLQNERMSGAMLPSAGEFFKNYGLTEAKLAHAKDDAIVMHPGPINRGIEIDSSVADGGRSVILPQVTFGIAVRMAVMSIIAGNEA